MKAGGAPEPSGWPPAGAAGGKLVPLFPLPNLFLFPGTVMPLHIFEPRYRQMIEDSLDGPGRLVIGTVLEQYAHELAGTPPVHTVAGLGEIARHERLPDGRFVIMLVGLARVQIREAPSERLYRKVEAVPLAEVQVQADEERRLRRKLTQAVLARTQEGAVLDRFRFDLERRRLRPVMLIDYERRPYVSRFDPEFRLTFDDTLRATRTPSLHPAPGENARDVLSGYTIMEVKFRHHVPSWFHRILQSYDLRRQSISKVCKGMETWRLDPDMEF